MDVFEDIKKNKDIFNDPIKDMRKPLSVDPAPKPKSSWFMKEVEGFVSTIETAFSVANSMALWPIQKTAGLSRLITTRSREEAEKTEQAIGEKLGYQPRTKRAEQNVGVIGKGFDKLLFASSRADKYVSEKVSPEAGYLVGLAGELLTFKMLHSGKVQGKAALARRKLAKDTLNKKFSDLTSEERQMVNEIAKNKVKIHDVFENEVQIRLTHWERAYERQKDFWLGKRDIVKMEADIEARLLKKKIKKGAKKNKRDLKSPRLIDEAIQIYIDLESNPGHLEKYYNRLNPRQREIVDLSQRLPDYAKEIADRIKQSYKEVGIEALEADIIRNTLNNFAARKWDLTPPKGLEQVRQFGTVTGHAKQRKFETILEGWAAGYELKIHTATENLRIYKHEIGKTVWDKEFVKQLRKLKDGEGNPLLSTRQLEGYISVEHPNMTVWEWAGKVETIPKIPIKKPSISKELDSVYDSVINSLPQKFKNNIIDLESITYSKFPPDMQGTGGHVEIGGTARAPKYKIFIEKGEKDIPTTLRHELLHLHVLKNLKLADEGFFGHEKAVGKLEQELLKPEKVKEKIYGRNFFASEDGQLFERRSLYAPKDQAKNINNMLGSSKLSEVKFVKFTTKYGAIAKAWVLQTSLFHHLAFMRSYYLPSLTLRKFNMTPRQAYKLGIKKIELADPNLMHGVRQGLTLGLKQDWNEALIREKTAIGRILDKNKVSREVKDTINRFREIQAEFLFGEFGAGLKALTYLDEFARQTKKHPNTHPDVVATRVALLINDDFGGLHLQRLGRNPTTQHIFRLAALAPDWTESNIRTMVKTLTNKTGSKAEKAMYRDFWAGVVVKSLGATALANILLAGGDLDTLTENYKRAWESGNNNWMKVDITPIYQLFQNLIGIDDKGVHKYWGVPGHFLDAPKFITAPLKSAKYKASIPASMVFEALTGQDWAGRSFTTLEELIDEGKTVKWSSGGGPVRYEQFPAYVLSQMLGTQPIQMQNFIAAITGEMEAFDALGKSIGLRITSTRPKKKSKFGRRF